MIKKQLIMDTALELFAENGIEATSIKQITDRCGISKGAFYLSFTSKNELIIAMIEHFISDFVAEIDRSVRQAKEPNQLLYNFFYSSFSQFQEKSDYAKIFMKENLTTLNHEVFLMLNKYDEFLNATIFSIIDAQFPQLNEAMRADLVFTIKGFSKFYPELSTISNYPVDLDVLSRSLAEKTTILARQATIPFITEEYFSTSKLCWLPPSKEQVCELLKKTKMGIHDEVLEQSIDLLCDNLEEQTLPQAVVQGLIKNLQSNSHCKWAAYQYELYSDQQEKAE
ncbi:TetR/AcrR family transcriptional regulator [Pradoshia sp.]